MIGRWHDPLRRVDVVSGADYDKLAALSVTELERNTRLQARVHELEAALRKYGEHSTQCNRLGVINGDCYCGFAGILDSLDEHSQSDAATEPTPKTAERVMQTDNPSAPDYDWQADREWFNQRLANARIFHNSELEQKIAGLERIVARHVKWRDKALRYLCMVRDRAPGYRPLITNFIETSTARMVESQSDRDSSGEVGK